MLTSQSWSQMQSVSSDSQNKANKQIHTLNGQNFLLEYNSDCFRNLLEPRIMLQSEEEIGDDYEIPNQIDPSSLRAQVSRNNKVMNPMSLQGSLTDI